MEIHNYTFHSYVWIFTTTSIDAWWEVSNFNSVTFFYLSCFKFHNLNLK